MRPNPRIFRNLSLGFACILVFFLGIIQPAFSQQASAGAVTLTNLDTTDFPTIRFNLEVFDDEGRFVSDLTFADIQVIENGKPLPLDAMQVTQPGLQIITAFAPAPIFSVKSGGVTLLDALKQHLVAWTQSQPAGIPDEFSIATSTGMLAVRLNDPGMWTEAVMAYQPNLLQAQATLVSLSQALDLAADPGTQAGQRQVIFYITALPPANARTSLEGLVDLATSLGVRVNVILVNNNPNVPLQSAEPLIRLADGTGGEFFVFTGTEVLPDLEAALQPLRYQYQASYTSRINATGSHNLRAQLLLQDLPLTSAPSFFQVNVQPPNPIFLSPPVSITRDWTEPEDRRQPRELVPDSQAIQVMIEFPDGHPRALKSTTFFVDGEPVAENTSEPFDTFTLPLSGYLEPARVQLQVEVVDSLGLTSSSMAIPVEILIAPEPRRFWGDVVTPERGLVAVSLVLATAILVLVLVFSGRRKKALPFRKRRDPVTQPVAIRQVKPAKLRQNAAASPLTIDPAIPLPVAVPARLVPLSESGAVLTDPAMPLYHGMVTFGSDSIRANRVLTDTSIHPRHCQITVLPEGEITVMDCGSTTGTWVNYAPVVSGSLPLEHGDLLHIGRLAFRFERSSPPENRRLVVAPFQEDEP